MLPKRFLPATCLRQTEGTPRLAAVQSFLGIYKSPQTQVNAVAMSPTSWRVNVPWVSLRLSLSQLEISLKIGAEDLISRLVSSEQHALTVPGDAQCWHRVGELMLVTSPSDPLGQGDRNLTKSVSPCKPLL